MKYLYLALMLILASVSTPTLWAQQAEHHKVGHGCARANLPTSNFYEGEFDRESLPAFIVSAQVPVYSDKRSEAIAPTERLAFGSRIFVVEPAGESSGARAEVADYSDVSNVYGWVDQQHLLCRRDPLRLANGIWRRAFVQTATKVIDSDVELNYTTKVMYDSSEGACEDDDCRQIGEFKWFFIYAERDGKLLVSEAAQLRGNSVELSGWLNLDDAILWDTASALRPSETLEDSEPEDYVCAYPSPESIDDPEQCRQVLGGERWFESHLRLPILDDVDDEDNGYWQVVFKGAGSNLGEAELLEGVLSTSSNANPTLSNLDVMFVIDGSRSMSPVIDAIKGTAGKPGLVKLLAERLGDKIDASNNYRVGFQIYRDSRLDGADGVRNSAAYSLANKPCHSDPTGFDKAFTEVEAQDDGWDSDFVENVYGGIMRGIKNLHSCSEHSKLIIVIGDHGYNATKQSDRDHPSYSISNIIRALYQDRLFAQPPILLFIQMPTSGNNTNQDAYDTAYRLFADQARELSEAWMTNNPQYKDLPTNEFNHESRRASSAQFKRLSSANVTDEVLDQIVEGVDSFFNPGLSAEILASGEAIVDAIDRMRAMNQYKSVPILWWGMAEQTLCRLYERRCEENILDKVQELYIPKSQRAKLVREVLMTDAQFNDWQGVLKAFRQLEPGRQTREQLLAVLKQKMGTNLGINIDDTTDADKTLGEILQLKAGLPHGFDSPILQYTENDIRADIPACELNHIVEVSTSQLTVLEAIEQGKGLPIFPYESANILLCTTMSTKGKALRKVKQNDVTVQPFNSPVGAQERSFLFSANNDQFFWLPIEWLP